jgi:hypothetical protein
MGSRNHRRATALGGVAGEAAAAEIDDQVEIFER